MLIIFFSQNSLTVCNRWITGSRWIKAHTGVVQKLFPLLPTLISPLFSLYLKLYSPLLLPLFSHLSASLASPLSSPPPFSSLNLFLTSPTRSAPHPRLFPASYLSSPLYSFFLLPCSPFLFSFASLSIKFVLRTICRCWGLIAALWPSRHKLVLSIHFSYASSFSQHSCIVHLSLNLLEKSTRVQQEAAYFAGDER